MVFVSNNKSSEILQPGKKKVLNFPLTPLASDLSAILGRWLFAYATVWRNHFNATVFTKLLIKAFAITGFIANKLIRCTAGKATIERCLDKLYFMGRSALHVSGGRKTRSVCDCQDLGAFCRALYCRTQNALFKPVRSNRL
jgi:hypothetical protein